MLADWEKTPAPGVLLMRLRSLEATVSAYDTAEGRGELYPSAIAAMIDLKLCIEDFLSLNPLVRQMQANSLTLRIQRSDVVEIHVNLVSIEQAARGMTVVDGSAVAAL